MSKDLRVVPCVMHVNHMYTTMLHNDSMLIYFGLLSKHKWITYSPTAKIIAQEWNNLWLIK